MPFLNQKNYRKFFISLILFTTCFIGEKIYSCDECESDFEEREIFLGDRVIDLGGLVIFAGSDIDDETEIEVDANYCDKILSRGEILQNASFHYKAGLKELAEAKKILKGSGLFTDKVEGMWIAATAAISVICGKQFTPWSPVIAAIIAYTAHETFKYLNMRDQYNQRMKNAKEHADEVDYWLFMLVKYYRC